MPDVDRVMASRRVVLPEGLRPASIQIRNGVIAGVGPYEAGHADDYSALVIMPGLVDTHLHISANRDRRSRSAQSS